MVPRVNVPSWPMWGTLALNLCFLGYHSWKLWQGAHDTHQWGIVLHCLAGFCVWFLYRRASRA